MMQCETTGGGLLLPELMHKLEAVARTQHLMVACDYDGTLSDLVDNPALALPHARAFSAFRAINQFECTTTAVVSGRALQDLDTFLGVGGPEFRIGSHGAEWPGHDVQLTLEQAALLNRVSRAVSSLAEEHMGFRCELKPAGVALHVRGVRPRVASMAIAAAIAAFGDIPGVYVRRGSEVIEFMVVPANKGTSVLGLKKAAGATAIVFVGDDLTDEDVFAVLSGDDVGIKVGSNGETLAAHRVDGPEAVAIALEQLALLRSQWVQHGSNLP